MPAAAELHRSFSKMQVFEYHTDVRPGSVLADERLRSQGPGVHRRSGLSTRPRRRREIDVLDQAGVDKLRGQMPAPNSRYTLDSERAQCAKRCWQIVLT